LKRYKSPGIDQIPAELIQAGDNALRSEIHKLFNSICNKEELHEQWKESIIVPVYKKGDKIDCSNYRGISPLSAAYRIVSNIFVSRLIPCMDEIIGKHNCLFLSNSSTTDPIFCICQMLNKKWEYNRTVHQLFIHFKKAFLW
jgi:sorting nexin-29